MSDELRNGEDKAPIQNRLIENAYRNRTFSLDAVREQTIRQFLTETAGRDDLLAEFTDEKTRRQAIREAADYVLATEYLTLSVDEKRWLIDQTHNDIFHLGPLSKALQDPTLTEISISNWQEVSVRHGFADLVPYHAAFDTPDHFEQLLTYALASMEVKIGDDPFLEVGLMLANRIIRLSLTGPPVMPSYSGLIRLHPFTPLTFDTLGASYPPIVQDLLQTIIQRGYGFAVVGDGGMGKTTLLGNLLRFAPENSAIVQRAAEVHSSLIPPSFKVFNSVPKLSNATTAFEDQIHAAVNLQPSMLFVDEIQGDEEHTFWPLLNETDIQLAITFRGRSNPRRLHSALGMAIRKADRAMPQEMINQALLNRLPLVVLLSQPEMGVPPRIEAVSQWTLFGEAMGLEPLLTWPPDQAEPARTDITPRLPL